MIVARTTCQANKDPDGFRKNQDPTHQRHGLAGEGVPEKTLPVRSLGPGQLMVSAYVNGRRLRALLDSGAGYTLISPRVVEKFNIPYQQKGQPIDVVLADGAPMEYGGGKIRLETTKG
jgi:predicted aspartyl protease